MTNVIHLFAQADPGTDAIEQLNAWWLTIGSLVPLVMPFVIKANAQKWFKWALSLGLSVVAALVVMLPQFDGSMGPNEITLWVFSFVGVVQTTYRAADLLVNARTKQAKGLNDLSLYRPDRGVPGPTDPYYGNKAA